MLEILQKAEDLKILIWEDAAMAVHFGASCRSEASQNKILPFIRYFNTVLAHLPS